MPWNGRVFTVGAETRVKCLLDHFSQVCVRWLPSFYHCTCTCLRMTMKVRWMLWVTNKFCKWENLQIQNPPMRIQCTFFRHWLDACCVPGASLDGSVWKESILCSPKDCCVPSHLFLAVPLRWEGLALSSSLCGWGHMRLLVTAESGIWSPSPEFLFPSMMLCGKLSFMMGQVS